MRIAPLAPVALAAALGVLVDARLVGLSSPTWAAASVAGLGIALAVGRRSGAGSVALMAGIAALGGGWHHYWRVDMAPDDLARGDRATPRPAWVRGVLIEVPEFEPGRTRPGDPGLTRTTLRVEGASDGRAWHPASGRLLVNITGDRTDLAMGGAVQAAGSLFAVPGPLNPGEADPRERAMARGARLRLFVDDPSGVWTDPEGRGSTWLRWLGELREGGRKRLVAGLDPRVAGLASALLLGRREGVDPDVDDAFARTGTTHLLAISGLHMQALALVLWFAAIALGLGRRRAYVGVLLASVAYAALVGLSPSVVRSAAMTALICFGALIDRTVRPTNLLAGAALATLALDPTDLFDAGCQFSFLCVGVLIWAVGPLLGRLGQARGSSALEPYAFRDPRAGPADALAAADRLFESPARRWARAVGRWLGVGLLTSTALWAAGAPLAMLRFHTVSPVGILLNLPLIPATSLALGAAGLSLLLGLIWAPLSTPFAWTCRWLLSFTEHLVRRGLAVPGGHAFVAGPGWGWVLGFYALLALAIRASAAGWRARRWVWASLAAEALAMSATMLAPARPPTPEAEVLAVGHGLAVLVRTPEGRSLLYDCGQMNVPRVGRRVVAPSLWAAGLRRLDAVVLSHADADHFNGLTDVLDRFHVARVCVPPGFGGSTNPTARALLGEVRARGIPVREVVAGDRIDLGPSPRVDVLHPPAGWQPGAPDNARSVVLQIEGPGGHRLLLTGDLEGIGQVELLATPPRHLGAMLAPHHGARAANDRWLYAWADPGLVVASQRRIDEGATDALTRLKMPVHRTWRDGAIRLRWLPSGLAAEGFVARGGSAPAGPIWDLSEVNVLWAMSTWFKPPSIGSRLLLAVIGLCLGASAAVAWAVVDWGAWALIRPGRKLMSTPSEPPPWEPIEVASPDGATLRGAWRPGSTPGRAAILLHGMAESRAALIGRGEALAAAGWSVLLADSRSQGRSGGDFATFGTREADDVRLWLDALATRAGEGLRPILWGRSMGAAIAVRAAAIDPRISALVLEAPYADLRMSLRAWLHRSRLPRWLAGWTLWRARTLSGTSLDRPRPVDIAPRVDLPVLILCGERDPIAPPAEARRLAAAFPTAAEVVEVPDARHADVFDVGGEELAARVVGFLGRSATDPGSTSPVDIHR